MQTSNYLKSVKTSRENDLRSYEKRKKQLEQILTSYDKDFDCYIEEINSNCSKIYNALGNALQGQVRTYLDLNYESGYDHEMANSRSSIFSEINAVNNIIQNLKNDISVLKTNIINAENEEREAKRESDIIIIV